MESITSNANNYLQAAIQDNANAIAVVNGIIRNRNPNSDFINDKSGIISLISGTFGRRW